MSLEVIVLGVGAMGAATCAELARRGHRVLGLEQFRIGHDKGSSHGLTRVIRMAYFEHPDYVPLLRRAYAGWYELEQRTGEHLFTTCGVLSIGPPESDMVQGVRASCQQHRLAVEEFSSAEFRRLYPQFCFPENYAAILEPAAGYLAVEKCVNAMAEEAMRYGAEIWQETQALSWAAEGHGVRVETTRGTRFADRLVITAGPWAVGLLGQLGEQLRVMRQVVHWIGTADDSLFRRDRFPIYITDQPEGYFYGFPVISPLGHKVAQHYGAPELPDISLLSREAQSEDEARIRTFLNRHLPAVNGSVHLRSVCVYTLSPDRHFVLDIHPEYPQVSLATGFSGHGFKFAPVVGEIMADFAERGTTDWPISMLRLGQRMSHA